MDTTNMNIDQELSALEQSLAFRCVQWVPIVHAKCIPCAGLNQRHRNATIQHSANLCALHAWHGSITAQKHGMRVLVLCAEINGGPQIPHCGYTACRELTKSCKYCSAQCAIFSRLLYTKIGRGCIEKIKIQHPESTARMCRRPALMVQDTGRAANTTLRIHGTSIVASAAVRSVPLRKGYKVTGTDYIM